MLTSKADKYRTLGIFLCLTLVTSMGQFVATPLAPFLMDELGLRKTQLGVLTSAVFWGSFASGVFSGLASDKLGEKKMILIGTIIITTALLCFSFSYTFIFFLISSFFIGAGYSSINALTNRGLTNWFPFNEKAFAIGMKQSGMPIGTAVGAAILPVLALSYSWAHTVKLLSLFILVSGIICFFLYHEPPKNLAKSLHLQRKNNIVSGPGNCYDCRLEVENISYFSLLTNRKILVTNLLGVGFVMTQIIIMTFTILYLQDKLSLSVVTAGHYLAIFQISGGISRPVFGYVGDHAFRGRRQYTLAALAVLTSGFTFALSLVSPSFPWWLITAVIFAAGFTALGWFGPYFALLTEIAGPSSAGMAIGLGITFNCLGISLGSPLFGFIVDTTGSFSLGYQLFAAWLLTDALLFLFLFKRFKATR